MTSSYSQNSRLVVGVDGSDESFEALDWAIHQSISQDCGVNAVYGWAPSWEVGAQPDDSQSWDAAYKKMESTIREWVHTHFPNDSNVYNRIILTSVRGSGQAALLSLGESADQIVVGRRNLSAMRRWLLGSTSALLVEEAKVPVTIVKTAGLSEEQLIAKALILEDSVVSSHPQEALPDTLPEESLAQYFADLLVSRDAPLPVVVGIDGSPTSQRALDFALNAAKDSHRPLHVLFCWQLLDLGVIPGFENSIAPMNSAQEFALSVAQKSVGKASIPDDVEVAVSAVHAPAAKGLAIASTYAHWLIVGSRGLSGLNAKVLGSVSSRLVDTSKSTLTVVH